MRASSAIAAQATTTIASTSQYQARADHSGSRLVKIPSTLGRPSAPPVVPELSFWITSCTTCAAAKVSSEV